MLKSYKQDGMDWYGLDLWTHLFYEHCSALRGSLEHNIWEKKSLRTSWLRVTDQRSNLLTGEGSGDA